jgi:hypothetical protein
VFPRFAANGLPGVDSVSRPTYFPRFNVVAGEAGREMLTVLARPRFMEVGGLEAVVGNAGPNRLAITNADALAGHGVSGRAVIEVVPAPGYEARIVENAIEGATVKVTQEMGRNSRLRDATKKAIK